MARLRFVIEQIKEIEETRAQRLEQAPQENSHAMVRLIARVIGVGVETADMLVHEVLARNLRDRRKVGATANLDSFSARRPEQSADRDEETALRSNKETEEGKKMRCSTETP